MSEMEEQQPDSPPTLTLIQQLKSPNSDVFTESTLFKQDISTQTFDSSVHTAASVQHLDVSTQSTSAASNVELGTQCSDECILGVQALSRFPENVLFSNACHQNVSKLQYDNWGKYLHHLEKSHSKIRKPSSPVAPSVNQPARVAVICSNQTFAGFPRQMLPACSNIKHSKSRSTSHLYRPIEKPQYTEAPPPWSPNRTLFMTYNEGEPPAYNECVETLVDTPTGYRSFQQQTTHLLNKKREENDSSLRCVNVQEVQLTPLYEHSGRSDYQALAFISCLFCWPVGLVAIYYSNMSCIEKSAGNIHQANIYSKLTFNTSLAALVSGVLGYFILCIYQSIIFL